MLRARQADPLDPFGRPRARRAARASGTGHSPWPARGRVSSSIWRARHAGLKRDDALKVLPDEFDADPERLARFRREAQVLASLNHPNIAHVHGLERGDGVQALVMELETRRLGDLCSATSASSI
jgi:hypothetical protein